MAEDEEYLESVRRDNQEATEAQEKKERRKKRTKIKLICYYYRNCIHGCNKIAYLRSPLNCESGTKDQSDLLQERLIISCLLAGL